ncbi:hypothetical protein GGR52DRAFT_533317 [Hypoxylon sp. FL1284]|nr:hypothetical protein GGR52DRAFT_533317 [Hypoxylon sp. FL1284]
MKVIPATVIALAALLQVAHANFDVYAEGIGGNGISGNSWGYQVYDVPPECGDVNNWIWRKSDDVSGGKYGVRCKGTGDGCDASGDPAGIQELEMNFNSGDFHWTIYAERDWGLFDMDDNQIGTCMPFPGDDFFCGTGVGRAEGYRKVRCLIDSVTSDDIKSHRPS